LDVHEPVAGNYYPITGAAFVRGSHKQMSVVNDRAQGGASLRPGEIEIMVHRRLQVDDNRGVGEPLDETEAVTPYPGFSRIGHGLVVSGTFKLMLATQIDVAARTWRTVQAETFAPLASFISRGATELTKHADAALPRVDPALSPSVDIMTLQRLDANAGVPAAKAGQSWLLVRLSHRYGIEDFADSAPARVELVNLFPGMRVLSVERRSLSNNQSLVDVKCRAMQWRSDLSAHDKHEDWLALKAGNEACVRAKKARATKAWDVVLGPMEITTLRLLVQHV
jgi:hypothetical protein